MKYQEDCFFFHCCTWLSPIEAGVGWLSCIVAWVLIFCIAIFFFFNISFLGVTGLLLQFVFYIIDFFAVFVLFVDCAFYSWIILIVSVFCNGICWLIMVFVNFVVLFFWAFYCLNEKLLFFIDVAVRVGIINAFWLGTGI